MEKLQYPIGKFTAPEYIDKEQTDAWTGVLEAFPERLEKLVGGLTDAQLDTPYRPGGWTVRQVVHHLYDSHTNSYVRFKWTLTEDSPVIKAYYEDRWAEVFDTKSAPVTLALGGLKALHAKWVYLLHGLTESDLQKAFIHPEGNRKVTLAENIGVYAWHCNHHYMHIRNLLERNGWLS
ncbi:YfiT family bacillithiol transferase [Sinomicrobium sp. M5D2P17]